jgi:hypothetical protein
MCYELEMPSLNSNIYVMEICYKLEISILNVFQIHDDENNIFVTIYYVYIYFLQTSIKEIYTFYK